MATNPNRRWITYVIMAAVGLLVIWLLILWVGWDNLVNIVGQANGPLIIAAGGAYCLSFAPRALRWSHLLRPVKVLPVRRTFCYVAIGWLANLLIPMKMGELSRAFLVRKVERASFAASLSTILVERVFDLISLAILAGLGAGLLGFRKALPTALRMTFLAFCAFTALVTTLLIFVALDSKRGPKVLSSVEKMLWKVLPDFAKRRLLGQEGSLVTNLLKGLSSIKSGARSVIFVLLLSLSAWGFELGMVLLVFAGFGVGLPFPMIVAGYSLWAITTMLPNLPGGLGTGEAYWILIFVGVLSALTRDQALAISMTIHVVSILIIVALGMLGLMLIGYSPQRMIREILDLRSSRADQGPESISSDLSIKRVDPVGARSSQISSCVNQEQS